MRSLVTNAGVWLRYAFPTPCSLVIIGCFCIAYAFPTPGSLVAIACFWIPHTYPTPCSLVTIFVLDLAYPQHWFRKFCSTLMYLLIKARRKHKAHKEIYGWFNFFYQYSRAAFQIVLATQRHLLKIGIPTANNEINIGCRYTYAQGTSLYPAQNGLRYLTAKYIKWENKINAKIAAASLLKLMKCDTIGAEIWKDHLFKRTSI